MNVNPPIMSETSFKSRALKFFRLFKSPFVLKNIVVILAAGLVFLLLIMLWLRLYTLHGRQITVDNYINALYEDAYKDGKSKKLELVIEDSLYVVGKEGGIILSQNPEPGAKVKKNRRIYTTITKSVADLVDFELLPEMYGHEINAIKKLLKQRFAIESEVVHAVFDQGPPNMIMAVIFEGDTLISAKKRIAEGGIPKGSTLQFVISKDLSEAVALPDLECKTLSEAEFVIQANQLRIGTLHLDDNVTDRYNAFVYRQAPLFKPGIIMEKGDTISLWITQAKPARCPDLPVNDNN